MYLKTLVRKQVYIYVVLILVIGAPFHFELNSSLNFVVPSVAFAKGGDGGGSDGGGSGSDGGGSDGGNSGSGSDGGNSGSGSDGGNSGSDDGNGNSGSGSDDGNESSSGDDGDDNNSKSNSSSSKNSQNAINTITRSGGSDIEVHYNNGWTEQIKSGLYELRDNINRKVISREARQDDYDRFRETSPEPDR
jgi:hypothetical protein